MLDLTKTINISRTYDQNARRQEITRVDIFENEKSYFFPYEPKVVRDLAVQEKYSPNPGDILYIGAGCNIPRIKLRDLLLNNHAKTTTDITKATHIFIDTTFSKMISEQWVNLVSKQQLLQFAKLSFEDGLIDDEEVEVVENILKDHPDNTSIHVVNSVHYVINDRTDKIFKGSKVLENNNSDKVGHINYIKEDYVAAWKHIHSNLDKVFNYKSLIGHINAEDSISITEEIFQQLSSMFNSEDKDNHILAMEIMANSNYFESLMYLEILFVDHGYAINISSTKRHVNFKSLTDYLGKHSNYLNNSTSYTVIDSLVEKKAVTLDQVKYILNRYKDDFYSGSNHFKVKQITLGDKLAKLLNVNYIKTVEEDYIPEIVEEEIEKVESNEEFNWVE